MPLSLSPDFARRHAAPAKRASAAPADVTRRHDADVLRLRFLPDFLADAACATADCHFHLFYAAILLSMLCFSLLISASAIFRQSLAAPLFTPQLCCATQRHLDAAADAIFADAAAMPCQLFFSPCHYADATFITPCCLRCRSFTLSPIPDAAAAMMLPWSLILFRLFTRFRRQTCRLPPRVEREFSIILIIAIDAQICDAAWLPPPIAACRCLERH
jgi:hypothetical protein